MQKQNEIKLLNCVSCGQQIPSGLRLNKICTKCLVKKDK